MALQDLSRRLRQLERRRGAVDTALFGQWLSVITALNETAEDPMSDEELQEEAARYAREGITFGRWHAETLGELWREERERAGGLQ